MIRRWEMAFWAILAGTTVQASCFEGVSLYGVIVDLDVDTAPDPETEETDDVAADVPGDPVDEMEDVEDGEEDE